MTSRDVTLATFIARAQPFDLLGARPSAKQVFLTLRDAQWMVETFQRYGLRIQDDGSFVSTLTRTRSLRRDSALVSLQDPDAPCNGVPSVEAVRRPALSQVTGTIGRWQP